MYFVNKTQWFIIYILFFQCWSGKDRCFYYSEHCFGANAIWRCRRFVPNRANFKDPTSSHGSNWGTILYSCILSIQILIMLQQNYLLTWTYYILFCFHFIYHKLVRKQSSCKSFLRKHSVWFNFYWSLIRNKLSNTHKNNLENNINQYNLLIDTYVNDMQFTWITHYFIMHYSTPHHDRRSRKTEKFCLVT